MRELFKEIFERLMTKLVDVVLDRRKGQEKYFKDYLRWAKEIKKETDILLKETRVFIFGSILKRNEIPRDIDILIVSPKLKTTAQKSKIRAKIWEKIGFSAPFEIHLITPEEYKNWYSHFIKEKIEIK